MRCMVLVVDSRPDMTRSPIWTSCSPIWLWFAPWPGTAEPPLPPPMPYSSISARRALRRERNTGPNMNSTMTKIPRSIVPMAMGRNVPEMDAIRAVGAWPLVTPSGSAPTADSSTTGSLAVTSTRCTVEKSCPSAEPSRATS